MGRTIFLLGLQRLFAAKIEGKKIRESTMPRNEKILFLKKCVLVVIIFTCLFSAGVFAYDADVNLGIVGISNMNNYGFYFENPSTNTKYSLRAFTDLLVLSGYTAKVEESQSAAGFDAVIGKRLNKDSFLAITRVSYFPGLKYNVDFTIAGYDKPLIKMVTSASLIYAGLGFKYQLFPAESFCVYFMGDVGYMSISGDILMESYDAPTDSYVKVDTLSGSQGFGGLGFNVGAGAKYYFSDQFFLNASAGFSGIGMSFNSSIGIGLDLDGNPAKGGGKGGSLDPSGMGSKDPKASRYEAYGDKLYASGDFKQAYTYYSTAAKMEKSSIIYMKIGNCFNSIGMADKARIYYDYADKVR
jgi:tetratricopeptide (TPR) repeat protein